VDSQQRAAKPSGSFERTVIFCGDDLRDRSSYPLHSFSYHCRNNFVASRTVCTYRDVRCFQAEIPGRMSEGSGNAAKKGDGYTYQTGKTIGYKIDNGKICLRFPNGQKGCVSVETDGKRTEMITRKGDRSDLRSGSCRSTPGQWSHHSPIATIHSA